MFSRAGHKVYLYAGESNDAECTEHIALISAEERQDWFGPHSPQVMPDVGWAASDDWWRVFNARATLAIRERAQPHDLLLLSTSWAQKPIADAFPEMMAVEYGVGYEGITGTLHCAFESYAWMHHVYGLRGIKDGRHFDAVIPNFFDPDEFPHLNQGDGDYLLYLGRITPRKGVQEAIEIAGAAGMRLVVAGPNQSRRGSVDEVDLSAPHVEYVGPVDIETRAELLTGARALLCPTRYIEPFGGVAIEAMLAGTPVLVSDFGAFTETVQSGLSGFRCRTLAEYVQAVEDCVTLDPETIRAYAVGRYSLEAVGPLYDAWFSRLLSLWGRGWYELADDKLAETKETANA
jgi:glycosyltransferase involved in cell wall biosynthesis